jgi:predicted nuclease of predicted toxin-antitoxin system
VLAVGEEAELRNREDDFHYQKARQFDRYILTHDDDFWDDRRFPLRQSLAPMLVQVRAQLILQHVY